MVDVVIEFKARHNHYRLIRVAVMGGSGMRLEINVGCDDDQDWQHYNSDPYTEEGMIALYEATQRLS